MKQKLPHLLALFFVSVTVGRVAAYQGGDEQAWLYSIGLAAGVFLASYYASYKTTSTPSRVALGLFIVVEGIMNTAEVVEHSMDLGRWDRTINLFGYEVYLWMFTDLVFGFSPTIFTAVLGWLGHHTEKLPVPSNRRGFSLAERLSAVLDWLLPMSTQGAGEKPADARPNPKPTPKPLPKNQPNALPQPPIPLGSSRREEIWGWLDSLSPSDQEVVSISKVVKQFGCSNSTASVHLSAWRREKNVSAHVP